MVPTIRGVSSKLPTARHNTPGLTLAGSAIVMETQNRTPVFARTYAQPNQFLATIKGRILITDFAPDFQHPPSVVSDLIEMIYVGDDTLSKTMFTPHL